MKQHNMDEIERLRKENEELKRQINILNNKNILFWSQLSHEIRTPLNAIVGMSQIWKDKIYDPTVVKDGFNKIEYSSRELLQIANNIVDYTTIAEDRMELKPVDFSLKDLITNMVIQYHPIVKRERIHLKMQIKNVSDEILCADEHRLNQLITCFFQYAVRNTPAKGTLEFVLKQASSSGGKAFMRFQIRTTGTRLFYALTHDYDNLARNFCTRGGFDGNGIELYICDYIRSLMKGKINYQLSGDDSELTLDFEFLRSQGRNKHEKINLFEKDRILILGENMEWCEQKGHLLKEIGVPYDFVTEYDKALDMIGEAEDQGTPYCICIFDWYSECFSGKELAHDIQSLFGDSIFLVATAYDSLNKKKLAKEEGVSYIIEETWFRSTIFDVLVQIKNGNVNDKEEELLQERQYDFKGRKVLIAEDIPINIDMITKLLNNVNISVTCAENGMEAVSLFRKRPEGYFDAILMDINMPIMDGYEATRWIRKSDKADAKTIAIYAMTANALSEDVSEALDSGMDGHIAKPIEVEVLYNTLEKVFKRRSKNPFSNPQKKKEDKTEYESIHEVVSSYCLNEQIENSKDDKNSVGLLLVHINNYADYCNNYDRKVTEKMCKQLNELLDQTFRASDIAIPLGEDRFAVLLNNVSGTGDFVINCVEEINDRFLHPENNLPAFSVCTGVDFSKEGYQKKMYEHALAALKQSEEDHESGCVIYAR